MAAALSILRAVRFAPQVTLLTVIGFAASAAAETRVQFDIPDAIECRDVTPEKCKAEHPQLKAIEGKFRLSARIAKGQESDVVDFLYMLVSSGRRLKIHDYLPNTTLESALADDHIEVAESIESDTSATEDAHVGYKIFNLGATLSQTSKKTEANHYKQIVPKALVLASGTTNREHGVFFKLRPSHEASLEGAKEFTFLAIVPKDWRGDWCTVACAARAKSKSLLPTGPTLAGIAEAHIGLYLSGDREASGLADDLCRVQEINATLLSKQLTAEGEQLLELMHEAAAAENPLAAPDSWLHAVFKGRGNSDDVEQAKAKMLDVQDRLARLSGTTIR